MLDYFFLQNCWIYISSLINFSKTSSLLHLTSFYQYFIGPWNTNCRIGGTGKEWFQLYVVHACNKPGFLTISFSLWYEYYWYVLMLDSLLVKRGTISLSILRFRYANAIDFYVFILCWCIIGIWNLSACLVVLHCNNDLITMAKLACQFLSHFISFDLYIYIW